MYRYIFLLVFMVSFPFHSFADDWGKTGHRAVGEIAEQHLSRRASKRISKLLDGQSLALVSNYGDDIKSDRAYDSYRPWHYVSFPFGAKYDEHPKSDKGDIIHGIETCIAVLKDDTSSKEAKVFHLKMLVHFIGDLHQPLHIGLAEDKGGNDFQVRWFNRGTNLHRVWDSDMLDSYQMSYTELALNVDALDKEEVKAIKSGTVRDWMYDSRALCEDVYAHIEIGEKLGYNYMYRYVDTLRFQLQKGGIRLAKLLNDIFG